MLESTDHTADELHFGVIVEIVLIYLAFEHMVVDLFAVEDVSSHDRLDLERYVLEDTEGELALMIGGDIGTRSSEHLFSIDQEAHVSHRNLRALIEHKSREGEA